MHLTFSNKRIVFYLWASLGWTCLWMFSYIVNNDKTVLARIPNEVWRTLYLLPVNFLFFEFGLAYIRTPKDTALKKIFSATLVIILLLVAISFLLYGWRQLGVMIGIYNPIRVESRLGPAVAVQTAGGLMSLVYFGALRHFYEYRLLKDVTQQLRLEKQQAELNFLKSQTNPHFLFNTLNNIYSLSKDKSDQAPESILRLSKMLRFMLYDTLEEYISLEQELKIIDDFIELEKLRYDHSLRIYKDYNIKNGSVSIPPLLLIPLVENAFKHGVSETRDSPFVYISLVADSQNLHFIVRNSVEDVFGAPIKENIGLTNLRRQLQLLYKDYSLVAEPKANEFTVTLKINLQSHV